jgi:hypothetical protein
MINLKATYTILTAMFIVVMLFACVQAEDGIKSYQAGNEVDLTIQCEINETVCSNSATCNITVIKPDTSILINNLAMNNKGSGVFNYTLPKGSTWTNGRYASNVVCSDGGVNPNVSFWFDITPSGDTNLIGFYFLIFLVIFFITFFGAYYENTTLVTLGGLSMTFLGLYCLINGISTFKNNITELLSLVTLGLGMYFSVTATIKLIEDIM